jgi:AcrR family transcriptional regulator
MRSFKVAPSESKCRLLEAAERLFAEHGFDRVSVRDITTSVEANVAAVNYHFGSREELVGLVISRILMPVLDERIARLEALEKRWSGKKVPVEEALDAWVRPVVGSARKSELPEPWFSKLLGRIFFLSSTEIPEDVLIKSNGSSERFSRILGKALHHLAADELQWRIQFVAGGLVHLLVNQDSAQGLGGGAVGSQAMESALGRLVRCSAACLREGLAQEEGTKEGPQAFFQF